MHNSSVRQSLCHKFNLRIENNKFLTLIDVQVRLSESELMMEFMAITLEENFYDR